MVFSEGSRLAAATEISGNAIPDFPGPVAPRTLLAYARDGTGQGRDKDEGHRGLRRPPRSSLLTSRNATQKFILAVIYPGRAYRQDTRWGIAAAA